MLLLDCVKTERTGQNHLKLTRRHRFGGLKMSDLDWRSRFYIGSAYGASKTAQLMTVMKLADQLKDTNVTINAMHPGGVRTNIGSNNGWLALSRLAAWGHLALPQRPGGNFRRVALLPRSPLRS
ncbi:MAG: SDR family NAD(P)-dependent oxidoreductase [Eubacteriales bacterium]